MYADLTWPELREAIAAGKVILLPVGTVEQHGPHLPLDTDNFSAMAICDEVGRRASEDVLIMPIVAYGFNWHHIDFPGTIGIDATHLINYLLDITRSLAYHGFSKILLLSVHGSNKPFLDVVARKTVMDTGSLCASIESFPGASQLASGLFKSPTAHACESETSLMLHLDEGRVQMDKAVREMDDLQSEFIYRGGGAPVNLMEWWSAYTTSGVLGDPTLATAEKGRQYFEAFVESLVGLIKEFRARPIRPRRDQH